MTGGLVTKTPCIAAAIGLIAVMSNCVARTKEPPGAQAQPAVRFVTVEKDVNLEVLDWGGSGKSIVLLTGLGDTAHVYDAFGPKLARYYHIYGITRRGFGASSVPSTGYSSDRLGDDVLTVIDTLKLDKPVLIGHSLGGEELSSVGSRHPEKIAGLIYLDAAYSYAYYSQDSSQGDLNIDLGELLAKLEQLKVGKRPADFEKLIQELLDSQIPRLSKDLVDMQHGLQMMPASARGAPPAPASIPVQEIMAGEQRYTNIPVPILAIFAHPHNMDSFFKDDPVTRAAMEARDKAHTEGQLAALRAGLPTAHVVLLPKADHYVFRSNEADVMREIKAFLRGLR